MAFRSLAVTLLILALGAVLHGGARRAVAQEWLVQSFDAQIAVSSNGSFIVVEDITVDFRNLPSHGIFRDIPTRYDYDNDHDRVIKLSNVSVDNGVSAVPFESSSEGGYRRLKIGDPDIEVTGVQRYRITYAVEGALNPFATHDELYWNVTGDRWDVPLQQASATVTLPGRGITQLACYQGPAGSTETCGAQDRGELATFSATRPLGSDEGLTLVLGTEKGLVTVEPPRLVDKPLTGPERVRSYFGMTPLIGAAIAALAVLVAFGLARAWWLIGRDRWYGDNYYLSDVPPPAGDAPRPLFAHQTIVVQYTPPEVGAEKQRMRPAEIGVLIDEKADTLDVSATIVDLAVRKYLRIEELPKEGIFGMFKSQDYRVHKLDTPDGELLPYERKLRDALFDEKPVVDLSDLKNKFHDDLQGVKEKLYTASVNAKFFPADPESVRQRYRLIGIAIIVAGGVAGGLLGAAFGGALIGLPVVLGGGALFFLAPLMPRRTAHGWEVYRRCLGFRLYMVTAETDRQKFAEDENIFHEYLPYAIVFGCVKKWAETFEQLGIKPEAGYYIGTHPFAPVAFAESMRSFSTSLSGVMASTPGGSGGSGFSAGGGFSGGGLGGGGGGRW